MKTLEDRVAVVTGGSRGIGAAIVKRLAREGASVVFTYSASADAAEAVVKEVDKRGGKASAIKADSADPVRLKAAIEQVIAQFGHIDILINNAAIYIGTDFTDHTLEDYQRIMNINVQAVFVTCLAAVKGMPDNGSIITIGSGMADYASSAGTTLYTMSKSALQGFTRGLARDLGPRKITVNLVQPGPVNTDMNPDDTPLADQAKSAMALSEYGTVEDIASLVNFLASDEARYMTGAFYTIDGGLNA